MNDEIEAAIPDAKPTGMTRSALLLAAMQAFLELERSGEKAEKAEKEDKLLAEFSELVVVPGVLAAE
ncbi:MAG: hypothetical protein K2X67_17890 [Burkholderiales bacterium]|nr:hypothetical protein [Burkholderiales bacterium]